jgi:hypothetical protein
MLKQTALHGRDVTNRQTSIALQAAVECYQRMTHFLRPEPVEWPTPMEQVQESANMLSRLLDCAESSRTKVLSPSLPDIKVTGKLQSVYRGVLSQRVKAMQLIREPIDRACRVYDVRKIAASLENAGLKRLERLTLEAKTVLGADAPGRTAGTTPAADVLSSVLLEILPRLNKIAPAGSPQPSLLRALGQLAKLCRPLLDLHRTSVELSNRHASDLATAVDHAIYLVGNMEAKVKMSPEVSRKYVWDVAHAAAALIRSLEQLSSTGSLSDFNKGIATLLSHAIAIALGLDDRSSNDGKVVGPTSLSVLVETWIYSRENGANYDFTLLERQRKLQFAWTLLEDCKLLFPQSSSAEFTSEFERELSTLVSRARAFVTRFVPAPLFVCTRHAAWCRKSMLVIEYSMGAFQVITRLEFVEFEFGIPIPFTHTTASMHSVKAQQLS